MLCTKQTTLLTVSLFIHLEEAHVEEFFQQIDEPQLWVLAKESVILWINLTVFK